MANYSVIGGRMGAPMTYDRFVAASQAMLVAMPEYPAGEWCHLVRGDDPIVPDALPVGVEDITSVASGVTTTSRRGDAWQLDVVRLVGRGRDQHAPLSVDVKASDGKRTWVFLGLTGLPDGDSSRVRATLGAYLRLAAETWQTVWMKVGTMEFHRGQDELGLEHGQVVLGWETYIPAELPFDEGVLDSSITVTPFAAGRIV